jgi:hypothetical protein
MSTFSRSPFTRINGAALSLVKGALIFGGISLLFAIFILSALFFFEDPQSKEQKKWCAEFYPDLTFEECSVEAGW